MHFRLIQKTSATKRNIDGLKQKSIISIRIHTLGPH